MSSVTSTETISEVSRKEQSTETKDAPSDNQEKPTSATSEEFKRFTLERLNITFDEFINTKAEIILDELDDSISVICENLKLKMESRLP
ncbi:unnamed protein product [Hermetia illucens]|uniref:Uncharacterized protein n=1 Tax=Hermetia illucens TaxID=343691 RepID=A0A7R8YR62_HERIL|nr:unnamed protein product [Hermetia illucens]